jgi:hypothetical protein
VVLQRRIDIGPLGMTRGGAIKREIEYEEKVKCHKFNIANH